MEKFAGAPLASWPVILSPTPANPVDSPHDRQVLAFHE
jgi:hypothetical protein